LSFFFDPIQLDLQLTHLLVQLRQKILSFPLVFVSPVGEDSGDLFQELLSRLPDLIRMDAKFTGELSDRLFPFYSLRATLALKAPLWVFRMF
jgi:hypothetical protein